METRREEELIQGIRLTRGITEEEARERVEMVTKIEKKAKEIEEWTRKESNGRNEEVIEATLISYIITKYKMKKRDEIIRTIHEATVTRHKEILKEAKTIREMGELKRT